MNKTRVGAMTIGQSPRPELVDLLVKSLPDCEIIEAGALDGLTFHDIPAVNELDYPLETQMKNGAKIIVSESFIAPRLQSALDNLEANGVVATLLMCTGGFSNLKGTKPLFKPYNVGCSLLRTLNMEKLGLITPLTEQIKPIRERWEKAGWKVTVWAANLAAQDQKFLQDIRQQINSKQLDYIVLDFFGHPIKHVQMLQREIEVPVIDLGQLAIVTLASSLGY